MSDYPLQAMNVSVVYQLPSDRVVAVNNVSLEVASGELVILEGPSGSGKSTFMSTCAGLVVPTTGSIIVDGHDITVASVSERADIRLHSTGIVFQDLSLLGMFTAIENVTLPRELLGAVNDNLRKSARGLLDRLGLGGLEDRYPSELSGGQQQRVAIARALCARPSIVFADEPTASLDVDSMTSVMKIFRAYCNSGGSVLMSTHDQRVYEYSNRVVSMRSGELVDAKA